LKGTKIQLKGKDLISMGIKPGPIFKKIFEGLLELRLNNHVKTKEDEVSFVEETFIH
jgi:tRNA nucleotidyltransferase (CCA-adding enzyme)